MNSLAIKLTLAFLLVGVVAVGLVGATIRLGSENEIERFVYDRSVISLSQALVNHYATTGNWSGVDRLFERNRFFSPQFDWRRVSIALVDEQRQVIHGQGEYRVGQTLSARTVQAAIGLEVGGKIVGRLLVRQAQPMGRRLPDAPETLLLQKMGRVILLSAAGAIILALVLGVFLARSLSKPIGELTAATDAVAQGKLGEQVPVRSQDELGRLAASFNRMSLDLARSIALRRQMTADVAHDLRTPLSLLLGYTEALRDGKLPGAQPTYAVMHDAAQQLHHLVDDLATLALADAGELRLTRRPVDPRALLERAALAFMAQAESQHISLTIEAADNLPAVNVDPDRINQALTNLVTNALRHTPDGGSVVLAAQVVDREPGRAVLLHVRDTGSGIAPEHLPHIFDRFYRGDKSRRSHNGEAGLGLAIARSIVENHGGSIEVASAVGQGAAFTIRLPL